MTPFAVLAASLIAEDQAESVRSLPLLLPSVSCPVKLSRVQKVPIQHMCNEFANTQGASPQSLPASACVHNKAHTERLH